MNTIIEVDGLKKYFKEVKAVDGVSFSVRAGSMVALLGLNGAGKTTVINILGVTLKKDAGKVMIDGIDIEEDPDAVKRRMGMVFQGSVLDGKLSVADNLKYRAALYGFSRVKAEERVNYVTELFELTEFFKRPYGKLSGGQRRRTDIARALLSEPKILILDEPTTGLDPDARMKIRSITNNLRVQKGVTILFTTHYMEETIFADDIIIMDDGKIKAKGTSDELKREYAANYLRLVCSENNRIESVLNGEKKDFIYKNNSYYVKILNGAEALEFLSKHRDFVDFEVLKGDMDDVFLTITGKSISGHQTEDA
ncbi:MAG: ABC transporter ATP-binding protein [Clostridiales bacterium]|nr:ABC transporter ATP-binding protein [Clostridiales bacterium]